MRRHVCKSGAKPSTGRRRSGHRLLFGNRSPLVALAGMYEAQQQPQTYPDAGSVQLR
jgi:hypothetical protein